jgi:2-polyprenyl-3-methyl-5-hydroxy-6-metoxy-1,4-benzoquinol methylase
VKEIVGTDFSARMIEIARRKAAAEAVPNVRFEVATAFDETLAPGSFDVVTAFNFLHLVEDLPGVARRVHALLKPGGRFVSKTVCLAEQSRLYRPLIAVLRAVGFAPYVHCLGIAELERFVMDAGFEIVETGSYPPRPPSRFLVARR